MIKWFWKVVDFLFWREPKVLVIPLSKVEEEPEDDSEYRDKIKKRIKLGLSRYELPPLINPEVFKGKEETGCLILGFESRKKQTASGR